MQSNVTIEALFTYYQDRPSHVNKIKDSIIPADLNGILMRKRIFLKVKERVKRIF